MVLRLRRVHSFYAVVYSAMFAVACSNTESDTTETVTSALGSLNLITRNYNNDRTGANLNETLINVSNVAQGTFRRLFQLNVDDQVYAGVLYASSVSIAGGTHNVLYVATVNNSVYAFDADTGGAPLKMSNFNNGFSPPDHATVIASCNNATYIDFSGKLGIVGTPVIDPNSLTMFVVTRTVENGVYKQWLRALDITTLLERGHTQIPSSKIDPRYNNQRAALALSQGKVYVAWASHCDKGPYHGRVVAFDQNSLAVVSSFDAAPTVAKAGIWMAGAAPVIDSSGNLYYETGNSDNLGGSTNFPNSIVKLGPALGAPLGSLRPQEYARTDDYDLGSAGPIVVPATNLLAMGGKYGGFCYLVNELDMSLVQKWSCIDETVRPGVSHHMHNSMVVWPGPSGPVLYAWGENDFGRAWHFNGLVIYTGAPDSVTSIIPPQGMPGGMLTLSASGSTSGTAVLWASMPLSGDANHDTVPGVLRAFNAEDLSQELWNSNGYLTFDDAGNFSKGSIPVVANGKVYLAGLSNFVSVYGFPSPPDLMRSPRGYVASNGVDTVVYHDLGKVSMTQKTGVPPANAVNLGGSLMAASSPWGYHRHDGVDAAVYIDRNGHLHERTSADVDFAVSFGINAPIAAKAPSFGDGPVPDVIGYVRSDNQSAIVYRSSIDHVIEVKSNFTGWPPWLVTDLTDTSGTDVLANRGSPFPYVRSDSLNTIVYIASDNHIHELANTGGSPPWVDGDLYGPCGVTVPPLSDPWGYVRSDGWNAVVYIGQFGGVGLHELSFKPGVQTWCDGVLPATSPYGSMFTRPSGYVRADGVNAVVYVSGSPGNQSIGQVMLGGNGWVNDPAFPFLATNMFGQPFAHVASQNRNQILITGMSSNGTTFHDELSQPFGGSWGPPHQF
jgi:hypothetical protein